MGIQTSLDALHTADRLIDAMRLADDLAFEAGRTGGVRTIRILAAAIASDDQLTAIAATHALAEVIDEQVDGILSALLSSERGFLREHAASALGSRLPLPDTVGRLIGLISGGGFGGMVAQRTLEQWSPQVPDLVAVGLEGALLGVREPAARYRLVETLGLVRGRVATRPLLAIAADAAEEERVRVAAVAALGQRRGHRSIAGVVEQLAVGDGFLAQAARMALVDLAAGSDQTGRPDDGRDDEPRERETGGLTVAQLFLHADIDAGLTQAGSGDNGGIATLLVRLGDELVTGDTVDRVLTLSRGSVAGALESVAAIAGSDTGHLYGRIPLLSDPVPSAEAWPLRVAARRGIRRILRASGGVDMLHLRMADVGSLAAADVARELDIPVVFTVAPDPHAVIQSLDLAGSLTRWNFGDLDEREHFWFRSRLVQELAADAAHTVLFPRPNLETDMRELVGIDVTAHPERHTIVPEGIDLEVVDRAVAEARSYAAGEAPSGALIELRGLVEALPEERRGLPLIVSVGRFHRVKGMATIVAAWASSDLKDRANLLLIGGNLDQPSPDEREQLGLMDLVVPSDDRAAAGLLLPGHQPNDTVARWVAAARFGLPGLSAAQGVYVCGSLKEEFGIALLEAMGSGLLVVAPNGGGPATYVHDGDTGFLTRTWDAALLHDAMLSALDAAAREDCDERADRSRATVEDSFTIQAMARSLSEVYGDVHDDEVVIHDWSLATR
ncbi:MULTISPECIES: glycosyltransferase [unclassified Frondihabitans]|uniref:glycosyltransferase n=1 Tax=unclassified Frondihabitans TaxID=2626248 RepID=UPI000F4EF865|nr:MULTISPECIES: glycosyltransferase [unclassified Frondihabitans]RPE74269.1 glycosyltransferase involved in cell wall biosynthesis [Frondihabitans sp. PhB153]RPF02698.1 glycosyltransferase involved in cell wall biosynthesis [Frondihabitans sp. PhB161]